MRVLPSVTLTSNQKRVLAKIAASPTPKVAGQEISGDQNLIGARDQLAHLGAIEFVAGEATMTEKGQQLSREHNITDEGGQLTPDGEQLAYTSTTGKEDKDKTTQPQTTPPPGTPQMGIGGPPPAPGGMGLDLTMSHHPMSFKEFLTEEITARITYGKAWDSEFAPRVFRFQRIPYDHRNVFNDITRRYPGARDAKSRFYWNKEHEFWYTESPAACERLGMNLNEWESNLNHHDSTFQPLGSKELL